MAPNKEVFIQTVQKYPILYDTSHREYKNIMSRNKIWDHITEILGEHDGDTLKKQWKNLRDAYNKHLRCSKPHTGQEAKLIDRYKTWPWATQMSFLRPYLEMAETPETPETHTNTISIAEEDGSSEWPEQRNDEEADSSHKDFSLPDMEFADTNLNIKTIDEDDGLSESLEHSNDIETTSSHQEDLDTSQHVYSRRKRTIQSQSVADKSINYISKEKDDDIDLLFKSYAKRLKKMTNRRQATVKFEIAKIMLKAELEEFEKVEVDSVGDKYHEMVMPRGQPGSADSDTVYIVPSPPPVLGDDPSYTASATPPSQTPPIPPSKFSVDGALPYFSFPESNKGIKTEANENT